MLKFISKFIKSKFKVKNKIKSKFIKKVISGKTPLFVIGPFCTIPFDLS